MSIIKGRNCKVEVGITEAASVAVSGVTLANPGVVTTTAPHTLADASVAYLNAPGSDLDGQVARVNAPASTTFELEGLNTTNYAAFTTGSAVPVSTWATLIESTQYQIGGGAPKTQDGTTLIDRNEKIVKIQNAAQTCTIDIQSLDKTNAALAAIRDAAYGDGATPEGNLVFRITHEGGSQRIVRGVPSLPGESLAQSGLGSGQLTVTVTGRAMWYDAP